MQSKQQEAIEIAIGKALETHLAIRNSKDCTVNYFNGHEWVAILQQYDELLSDTIRITNKLRILELAIAAKQL